MSHTVKCGSMTCRNCDGTCDGGWILKSSAKQLQYDKKFDFITHDFGVDEHTI